MLFPTLLHVSFNNFFVRSLIQWCLFVASFFSQQSSAYVLHSSSACWRYHPELGAMTACTNRMAEETKELCQSNIKVTAKYYFFFVVGLPQRGCLRLQLMLVLTWLVWLKNWKHYLGIKSIADVKFQISFW